MKKLFIIISLLTVLAMCFSGCGKNKTASNSNDSGAQGVVTVDFTKNADGYYRISAEVAHEMMVSESGYVILDVREEWEYNEAHITGAVLLPVTQIIEKADEILPDKNQKIFVYCRSGNRSLNASADLAALGYTNVWEFGGIIDWPYDVTTPNE